MRILFLRTALDSSSLTLEASGWAAEAASGAVLEVRWGRPGAAVNPACPDSHARGRGPPGNYRAGESGEDEISAIGRDEHSTVGRRLAFARVLVNRIIIVSEIRNAFARKRHCFGSEELEFFYFLTFIYY